MSETAEFSFGDNSVASAYDNVLVRFLFEPWAVRLIEENQPWEGRRVLDLATGTGITNDFTSNITNGCTPSGSPTRTPPPGLLLRRGLRRLWGLHGVESGLDFSFYG